MRTNTIGFLIALLAAPATARAGGIVLPGLGPQAQARAGAFTAKADDPSALFHNPAGFAKQKGLVVYLGFNLLDYSMEFQRAGTYDATGEDLPFEGQPFPVTEDTSSPAVGLGPFQTTPLLAISSDLGGDLPLRVGFGVYAPHSYPDRAYDTDYVFEADPNQAPPPGRYDIFEQQAMIILPSFALAYSVTDQIDVGVRASWGIGQVKATTFLWGIQNYEEWVANDALFAVDVTDNFMPSFGAGAMWRPSPSFELALAYDNGVTLNGKGWGDTTLGSNLGLSDQHEYLLPADYPSCGDGEGSENHLRSCLELGLPRTVTVGGRYILRDQAGGERADLEFDVKWEQWSAVSDIKVIVDGQSGITGIALNDTILRHGFQDTFSFRVGGSYRLAMGGKKLTVRGGAAYDTATAPQSWTRLDMDGARRALLAAGLAYDLDRLRFELGGGVVIEPDRTVGSCNPNVFDKGCAGTGRDTPQSEREHPDPLQPLSGPNNQVESPFNGGTYQSGYFLLSLGASYRF